MDKNVSLKLYYDIQNKDFNDIVSQIDDAVIDGIILFGQPTASLELERELEQKEMNQPIFGTLSLLNEDELPNKNITDYKNMELIYQGNMSGSKGLVFRNEYKKAYGKLPGAVAAYSYDGMNILIEAIRNAGLDRENIQKTISKMRFEGVTGLIQFDDKGKRVGIPGFIEIKNGVPVIPDK